MLFTMNSRAFFDVFLKTESKRTIRDTFYAVCSPQITQRRPLLENVISCPAFVPAARILGETGACAEAVYKEQLALDEYRQDVCILLKAGLDNNVVFLTTEREYEQLPFMHWLKEFVWDNFGIPVVDYLDYVTGKEEIPEWDKKKARKRINMLLLEALQTKVRTQSAVQFRDSIFSGMKKKELKDCLLKMGAYSGNMSRGEMIDMLLTLTTT